MMLWLLFTLGDSEIEALAAPGLEFTLPDTKLHFTLPDSQLHFTLPEEDD